ncbi:MAG: CPBP family intramembrane metalloprotease [Ignavibacteria bacterium]|nr:CPBP family intramembrane metalloprotease [Ignavibacteria bacterium]
MSEDNEKPDIDQPESEPGNFDSEQVPPLPKFAPRMAPVTASVIGLILGFFLYQIVGGLITLLVLGFKIESADANSLRLMQTASQMLFLLLPSLVLSKFVYEDVTTVIRFRMPEWKELTLFIIGMFILIPLVNNLMIIQDHYFTSFLQNHNSLQPLKKLLDTLNTEMEAAYKQLMQVHSPLDFTLVVISVALTPAICEEVLFRGYVQTGFEHRFGKLTGAIITALLFSIYHVNFQGLIGLFMLGLFFGYAVYQSDSIVVPMVLHFLNNFSAVVLFVLFGESEIKQGSIVQPDALRSAFVTSLFLTGAFIIVVFSIRKYYTSRNHYHS